MWLNWIQVNRPALLSGLRLDVPGWFPDPTYSGLRPVPIALPVGQTRDWSLPLSDGSRIHVHKYADGRRIAHRDRYDPDVGLGNAVLHLMFETPLGLAALVFVVSRKYR